MMLFTLLEEKNCSLLANIRSQVLLQLNNTDQTMKIPLEKQLFEQHRSDGKTQ